MKFICFGYVDPVKFAAMSQDTRDAFFDSCFEYDDFLRANGHWAGGHALEAPTASKSLRPADGRVHVTDGPYAETKEFVGGILVLEARDIDHAVELMTKHPSAKFGPWEIRPAPDMCEFMRESRERRALAVSH